MKNSIRKKTQNKIQEIRKTRDKIKKAGGRKKGYQHSEETIDKIREAKIKRDNQEKAINTFDLETILEQAKADMEDSIKIYNIDISGMVEIYATDWDGYWILGYFAHLHNISDRIIQMLEWPQTRIVNIRTTDKMKSPLEELVAIIKVGERFVILGDYEIGMARIKRGAVN